MEMAEQEAFGIACHAISCAHGKRKLDELKFVSRGPPSHPA